jgi:hypothetical protein
LEQKYLRNVRFQRKPYRLYREGWDHDHCAGCGAKFALEDDPSEPVYREGYATCADYVHGAEYDWVCVNCFAEFKDAMGWVEVPPA